MKSLVRTKEAALPASPEDRPLLTDLLGSREGRAGLAALEAAAFQVWAGPRWFRRFVVRLLHGGLAPSTDGGRPLSEVLGQPQTARQLATLVPVGLEVLGSAVAAALEGLARLEPDEQAAVVGELLSGPVASRVGALVTGFARLCNQVHGAAPDLVETRLRPALRDALAASDLGEVKEAVDRLAAGAGTLLAVVADELFRYPAKAVTLLSLLPPTVNAGLSGAAALLSRVNRLPPDLLADLLLSLVRELDAPALGALADEAAELVRKVHTGSVLIGEPGKPQLPADLSAQLSRLLASVHGAALLKAQGLLDETSEAVQAAATQPLASHPELARGLWKRTLGRPAARLRALRRALDAFEHHLGDEDQARVLDEAIAGVDMQDAADLASRLLSRLARALSAHPGLLADALGQTLSSLDEDLLASLTERASDAVVFALRPLAPRVMPPLLKGLAALIAADGSGPDPAMTEAIAALRDALLSPGQPEDQGSDASA